jgi:uncharacterized protein (TIGR03435 family)
MERIILECVVRATLIALGTQTVLSLTRVRSGAARHNAWACVVVAMLCLPSWTLWGPKASIPMPTAPFAQTAQLRTYPEPNLGPSASPPLDAIPAKAAESRLSAGLEWRTIGLGIYLVVAGTLLLRLLVGTLRAQWLIRETHLQNGRLTSGSCSSPVTVGWVRPITILPAGWPEWPEAKLDAVLAHENEHVRRRDPLFQWLALLNRALFWFHPLSWWLERRLASLAEEACDAAVLASGHDPQDYCTYLLDIADTVANAGRRLDFVGMEMPGSSLSMRIRQIVAGLPRTRMSRIRLASVIAACAISTAVFAAATFSQSTFEVATIKPSGPDRSGGKFIVMQSTRHYVVRNYTFKELVGAAYDLPLRLVSGGPDWISFDRFDIDGLTPGATRPNPEQQMLMLRALLADRFKLTIHREQRDLPVYELTVAKTGAKLQESTPETAEFLINRMFNDNRVLLPARNVTMAQLASMFQRAILDRPVLDKTGLSAHYNFDLEWTREEAQFGGIPLANVDATPKPDLFTALEQQVGLRLQSARGSVDVVVIDRVERPSAN